LGFFRIKVEKYRSIVLGKSNSKEDALEVANTILKRYFNEYSDYEINITAKEKQELNAQFQRKKSNLDPFLFDVIQSNIFALMAQVTELH
jgi:hypothetical protein